MRFRTVARWVFQDTGTNLGSMYYSGKALAKFAAIV